MSSCATYTTYSGAILNQTNVTLSANNFRYVKLATGTAVQEFKVPMFSFSFFGPSYVDKTKGGPEYDAMVLAAKRDLLSKNPLKDGQVLANMTVDTKSFVKGKMKTITLTLSADVIEFR